MTFCSTNRPWDQSSCLAAALGANKLTPAKDVVLSKLDLSVKHHFNFIDSSFMRLINDACCLSCYANGCHKHMAIRGGTLIQIGLPA
jgi:hypothetical protein